MFIKLRKLEINRKKLVFSGIFTIFSISSGWAYIQVVDRAAKPLFLPTVIAEPQNIENAIDERGILELGNQQILTSPLDSAVEDIFVAVGEQVKVGQALIALRNPEGNSLLLRKQLEIENKEMELVRSQEKIYESQQKLQTEQRKLNELKILDIKGFIARDELQSQQEQVTISQSELRESTYEIRSQERELQLLKLELKEVKQQLQSNIVTAPIDGKILEILTQKGNGIQRGSNLLVIGDPNLERVKLKLPLLNAAKIKVGQRAKITVIGIDSQKFDGQIRAVSPSAANLGAGSEGGDGGQITVPAIADLDVPSGTLIPGSLVNVRIILERRENVVSLPVEAIQRSPDNNFVWMQDPQQKARKQPIEIGLENLKAVEIISGLNTGDRVFLPNPESPLQEGIPIMPE